MAKTHHDVLVGMMGVTGSNPGGASSYASLKTEIKRIYMGDSISPYQACNTVHSYVDSQGWTQDTDKKTEPFGWKPPNDPPDAGEREERIENNAEACATFIRAIAEVNDEVGGGNLKGTISRILTGLVTGQTGVLTPWELDDLGEYAQRSVQKIKDDDNEDLVAGWYLADESWVKGVSPKEGFRDAAKTVHIGQLCKGVNWPFLWEEPANMDFGSLPNPTIDRYFWKVNTAEEWEHAVWPETDFAIWLNYFFPQNLAPTDPNREDDLEDATLVFMPFDFPWGSSSTRMRYRRHKRNTSDVLRDYLNHMTHPVDRASECYSQEIMA